VSWRVCVCVCVCVCVRDRVRVCVWGVLKETDEEEGVMRRTAGFLISKL